MLAECDQAPAGRGYSIPAPLLNRTCYAGEGTEAAPAPVPFPAQLEQPSAECSERGEHLHGSAPPGQPQNGLSWAVGLRTGQAGSSAAPLGGASVPKSPLTSPCQTQTHRAAFGRSTGSASAETTSGSPCRQNRALPLAPLCSSPREHVLPAACQAGKMPPAESTDRESPRCHRHLGAIAVGRAGQQQGVKIHQSLATSSKKTEEQKSH